MPTQDLVYQVLRNLSAVVTTPHQGSNYPKQEDIASTTTKWTRDQNERYSTVYQYVGYAALGIVAVILIGYLIHRQRIRLRKKNEECTCENTAQCMFGCPS